MSSGRNERCRFEGRSDIKYYFQAILFKVGNGIHEYRIPQITLHVRFRFGHQKVALFRILDLTIEEAFVINPVTGDEGKRLPLEQSMLRTGISSRKMMRSAFIFHTVVVIVAVVIILKWDL